MLKISAVTKQFSCAIAGSLLTAAVAMAGETAPSKEVVKPEAPPASPFVTGDAGVAFVSKYFSRGINLTDQGVIAQPYADLYLRLYEGDGFINKVTLNLGLWSSIQSFKQPGPHTNSSAWYEFDYTAGIATTFAKSFTFTASYFEFISPADNFPTARNLNFSLAYDDSGLLGAFALHPHFTVLAELNAPGYAGLDYGGWYYEFGIAPGFAAGPVTFTFPLTLGLGDDNFYADETYGYFSAGAAIAVPLSFIPPAYGSWTFGSSATYYNLGSTTKAANHDEGNDFVFSGSIGLTF